MYSVLMAAQENRNTKLFGGCMLFFLTISCMLSTGFVDGRRMLPVKNMDMLVKNKGMSVKRLKTTERENQDEIDCVDIYKQPAFNHPLLKNHTIQMKPSSYPKSVNSQSIKVDLQQSWLNKHGECPEGTIPIIRTKKYEYPRTMPLIPNNTTFNHIFGLDVPPGHEYAQVSLAGGNYYGTDAVLNVWNPVVSEGELSLAQIWILNGNGDQLNTIEAGWMVQPGENVTRFFIYWTSDGYQKTGCYNLDCPGFVQASNKLAPGVVLEPVSTYNGKQFEISIHINRDNVSGHWWLELQDEAVGYWPDAIIAGLKSGASAINWGGEIINLRSEGHHTRTQMGSGSFPNQGSGKASYFTSIKYADESPVQKVPQNLIRLATNPSCYDLVVVPNSNNADGARFFFGGPGYSAQCP